MIAKIESVGHRVAVFVTKTLLALLVLSMLFFSGFLVWFYWYQSYESGQCSHRGGDWNYDEMRCVVHNPN